MVYKLGKFLGRGSDGVVYELLEDKHSSKVIKFIQGENFGVKNYMEYYILYNLDQNYITSAFDIQIEKNGLLKIVQPRAKNDIKHYISKNNLNIEKKINIINQITKCIYYLHSQNILHGDVKPSNILIFDDNSIKLSDFNLSKLILDDNNNNNNNKLYTINFRPPEINENNIDIKSDIWALGCTFYEIYYGVSYFNQGTGKKFFHLKEKKELEEKNKTFNNLISNMIEKDLEKRYDIEQVLNHDFFKEKSFHKLDRKKVLTYESFMESIEKDMERYYITKKRDKNIFISKIFNNCNMLLDNNYKKIEKLICSNKFDFRF